MLLLWFVDIAVAGFASFLPVDIIAVFKNLRHSEIYVVTQYALPGGCFRVTVVFGTSVRRYYHGFFTVNSVVLAYLRPVRRAQLNSQQFCYVSFILFLSWCR